MIGIRFDLDILAGPHVDRQPVLELGDTTCERQDLDAPLLWFRQLGQLRVGAKESS